MQPKRMKAILIGVIIAVLIALGIFLYRSNSANRLQVDPNASKEIEKAKHR
jgi:hypothetical protein